MPEARSAKPQDRPVELEQAVQMVELFSANGMADESIAQALAISARAGLNHELQQRRFSRKVCRSLLDRLNAAEAHQHTTH